MKWVITIVLSCVVLALSVIDFRLWFRHYLQHLQTIEQSSGDRFWYAASIIFVRGIALIGILLVWNSFAWKLLDVLILINFVTSILGGISQVSPGWLARWWRKIGNLKKW